MMVLLGTKEGFNISDKWICERTGLQHPSYITARKALVKRGWLTHEAAKGITVNIKAIYAENSSNTTLPKEENENSGNTTLLDCSNTILPQGSNTTLPQCSNTILPITYNTDNKTNKETNRGLEFQPQAAESTKPTIYQKVSKQWLEDNNIAYRLVVGNLGEVIATGARIQVIE